jgi:hypothetical protein
MGARAKLEIRTTADSERGTTAIRLATRMLPERVIGSARKTHVIWAQSVLAPYDGNSAANNLRRCREHFHYAK